MKLFSLSLHSTDEEDSNKPLDKVGNWTHLINTRLPDWIAGQLESAYSII